ncbi:sulfite exporter TauE/SafE family protein [Microbacterium bovistercoris]|uniref:Probable membrane transporter protein n=1 Tax=Microbacterium bovistercoris TaxID=2293570 RepID=A0A371NPK1_9MICO|nr:sulfite exporter TauE/SafE family protein [Microbacterium bovistercoris]REJ04126.1 sulfite exporter TauE/SafE family protein [Microbacterium bovistercoris]
MELLDAALIALAGTAAGAINALAGGGSLVTFPTLLALGYPPVLANVTNTVAAFPGYVGGAWGYRAELSGQRRRILVLGVLTAVGALIGSALLLLGSEGTFRAVVPWLILGSTVLMAVQPAISKALARRAAGPERLTWAGVGELGVGIYGGYFNAGLGFMMLGVMGMTLNDGIQRLNALKSVMSAVASLVSLVFFVIFAEVAWPAAIIMAISGLVGGWIGARVGRRIPPAPLRWSIVAFGLILFLMMLTGVLG